ncbi:chromosome partitioning protein ParA, partial [Shewanella sp. A25]|nr:chromosome partitioning protein ParA [Shewanella shenzhenensis]
CKMVNPKMLANIVLTQCPAIPTQVKRILESKEVVQSFCLRVLKSVTFSRNIYHDSEHKRSTVNEIEPQGNAPEEIRAIV